MFQGTGCPNKYTLVWTGDDYQKQGPWCQTVSDGCVPPPITPTLSPTANPNPVVCEDSPATTKFNFVNNGREIEQRSCRFIRNILKDSDKPRRRRRALCEEEASVPDQTGPKPKIWSMCPRTCQVCPDQCKDKRPKFTVGDNPKPRNCGRVEKVGKWASGNRRQRQLCNSKVRLIKSGRKVSLHNICQESCGKVGVGRCSPMLDEDAVANVPFEDNGAAPVEDDGAVPVEDDGAAPVEDDGSNPVDDD